MGPARNECRDGDAPTSGTLNERDRMVFRWDFGKPARTWARRGANARKSLRKRTLRHQKSDGRQRLKTYGMTPGTDIGVTESVKGKKAFLADDVNWK